MSWELTIRGGKTIALAAWHARLRRLGAIVELHPAFALYRSGECLPIALTILPEARFAEAARFARAGKIAASLELAIEAFGPLDPRVPRDGLVAEFEQRVARLVELGAPDVILEHERERLASLARAVGDAPDEQRVYVRAPEGDYLAHTLCSAAYALACGGTLHPLDTGGAFADDEVLAWLAERFTRYALSDPEPFRGWDAS